MGPELVPPNFWMTLPFGMLLVTMAVAPLVSAGWWEHNYAKVAGALSAVTLGYYLLGLHAYGPVLHTAREYLSFIALIGALYIVAGGIHLRVPGVATPAANTAFLFVGALVANLLGTTGAAVLLIRPWLRLNRRRVAAHHVVFFIFVVANVGGCLTPVGDPPLFLGYLKGIPFWWVARECGGIWLVGMLILLAEFYVLDHRSFARAASRAPTVGMGEADGRWQLDGAGNLVFLALILVAVFIQHPPLLREALMVTGAVGSIYATRPSVRAANQFSFRPLIEVSVLFAGVFATMLPALQWLEWRAAHSSGLTPGFFYWATGVLSSVLDNAPTYLGSVSAACGAAVSPDLVTQVQHLLQTGVPHLAPVSEPVRQTLQALQQARGASLASTPLAADDIRLAALLGDALGCRLLAAVSVAAVFFGAATYLGNAPNFLVKAIADHQKVPTPTFLGFVLRYTLPCLAPMLAIVWWLFFRG